MIFRNHNNMLICCSRNVEYLCGNCDTFYFSGFFDEYKVNLFKIDVFCNSIDAFTVTFDQFNASLKTKSITFFQKLTPNFRKAVYILRFSLQANKNSPSVTSGLQSIQTDPVLGVNYEQQEETEERNPMSRYHARSNSSFLNPAAVLLSILMRASAARTSHSTPLHNEGAREKH